jgi:hypothetical protein
VGQSCKHRKDRAACRKSRSLGGKTWIAQSAHWIRYMMTTGKLFFRIRGEAKIFSPQHVDDIWVLLSLPCSCYWNLFAWAQKVWSVKITFTLMKCL